MENVTTWNPTVILDVREVIQGCSTEPLVVVTDQGMAVYKSPFNQFGPHTLVCEYVGTRLAQLLGLPTLTFCIFKSDTLQYLSKSRTFDIPQDGIGFMTKWENGVTWHDAPDVLNAVQNKECITQLVYLDTWIKNDDRFFEYSIDKFHRNDRNVFFRQTPDKNGKYTLLAIDHTEAFKCVEADFSAMTGMLTLKMLLPHVCHCNEAVYGLFPEFRDRLKERIAKQCQDLLINVNDTAVKSIIDSIPHEWNFDRKCRQALRSLILRRAEYTASSLYNRLFDRQQGLLNY